MEYLVEGDHVAARFAALEGVDNKVIETSTLFYLTLCQVRVDGEDNIAGFGRGLATAWMDCLFQPVIDCFLKSVRLL
jgi:hypothetical protein